MVRAGDEIYIVDIGDGANRNLGRWRIPMNKVQAVLLTHLHSDHISDLADLHLATWIPNRKSQLKVYGLKELNLLQEVLKKHISRITF